jgi:hypothetical protein
MAIEPLAIDPAKAYSEFDFSPLARLGEQAKQDQSLAALGRLQQQAALPPASSAAPSGASAAPSAPFNGDKKAVATALATELRTQGFSDHAIAGILYNVNQESAFDPTLRHPDQPRFGGEAHYAHGLFQEGGDEWNTWDAHMKSRGAANWQDPTEQARFVAGRLKGDIGNAQYANVLAALQGAKSKEDAAKIFASGYLKPAQRYLTARIGSINAGIPDIGYYTGEH